MYMFIFDEFKTDVGLIQLVLPEHSHAPKLFEIVEENRDEFKKWFPWTDKTNTVNDELAFINSARVSNANYELLALTILLNDEPIGFIDLHNIDAENHSADIGYWMDSKNEGHGIMTTAVKRLTLIAHNELSFHKIRIEAADSNHRSQAVARRAGFTHEATLHDNILTLDGYRNVDIFSHIVAH